MAAAAAILIVHSAAQARLCVPPTVEQRSPYRFLLCLSNALVSGRQGLARLDSLDSNVGAYEIVVALRLQQTDYKCARSQVAPYVTSSDTIIAESAGHATKIFDRLIQLDDEMVSQAKAILEPSGTMSPSAMAERQAETQSDLEHTWGLLVHIAIFSTYSVIREDPQTGRMSRLALTAAQRDEILGVLRAGFGRGITGGLKAGQHSLEASAASIYSVVGDPGRQLQEH